MIFSSVDLPHPLGPTTASLSPATTLNVRLSNSCFSPSWDLARSSAMSKTSRPAAVRTAPRRPTASAADARRRCVGTVAPAA
eukprot:127735-Chlamydomonas_euryale.AAC.5